MRLMAAILVISHMLLSGVDVPCAHDHGPDHARRPHIHLAPHRDHGTSSGTLDHDARGHECGPRHVHHAAVATHGGTGLAGTTSSDHDADAVYAADEAPMFAPDGRFPPADARVQPVAVVWQAAPVSPRDADPRPRSCRPPGGAAATIHTLLPHLLRV